MYQLFRSLDRDGEVVSALPPVWPTFEKRGIKMCPGDFVMWVGPPGAGKSAAALNYILGAKVPTLYVSMDMGPRLVASRICAIKTGTPVSKVAAELETPEGVEKYRPILRETDYLYVTYPSRPTMDKLAKAQMAFMEIHGIPSDLMVIDNLMNMDSGLENENQGFREICQGLHYMSTELQITTLALHHINLGGVDISLPAPEVSIKGKVSELQATIISYAHQDGKLLGAAVKNRHGKADHTGRDYFTLSYDEVTQTISEYVPPVQIRENSGTGWSIDQDWLGRGVKDY
jgi:hypothetical protein